MSIYSINEQDSVFIQDRIVFVNKKPIGIICPSSLEGLSKATGSSVISGPAGIKKITSLGTSEIIESMIETGSIVFGDKKDINECNNLLANPKTSRTVAYLFSISKNCRDICDAVNNLSNASVLIIGCGGIGALAAFNIAGAGVKRLGLIDGDVIEESNLNRQFFWRLNDIGSKKVEILTRELNDRYPDLEIDNYDDEVSNDTILSYTNGYDLVILTADEPLRVGDEKMKTIAKQGSIKLITCGYFHSNLTITFTTKASDTLEQNEYSWRRNPWFIGPSFGPNNTELAGLVTSLSIHTLAYPKSAEYNQSFTSHWNSSNFPRIAQNFLQGTKT